jgi:polyphosphate kinase
MASEDPRVLAIKMTLYRTGNDSPFISHLIRAAEQGKQVACLVELQARFDEERNIILAEALEDAGVHVVYGLSGLKTHCKLALIVRNESDGVRCYAHIGTGNYHAKTSFLYTDFGLFTAVPVFTDDVVALFHHLTGRSLEWEFNKLLVAPHHMKRQFLQKIKREAENARSGAPAHIIAKMNGLEDEQIIEALCEASEAGVKIDLIVRGICCLRPGVAGVSSNIRVFSIIGDGEIFIGSADWMSRNLNERVEAVVPLESPQARTKVWETLQIMLEDRRQSWELQTSGVYVRREEDSTQQTLGTHGTLMELTLQRTRPSR